MKFNVFCLFFIGFIAQLLFPQNTYFLKYKETVSTEQVNQFVANRNLFSASALENVSISKIDYLAGQLSKGLPTIGNIVKFESSSSLSDSRINDLINSNPEIEYIEKSKVFMLDNSIPNDSLISQQWALSKIDAFSAWNKTKGKDSIVVGVIDTGIDYNHPDLVNKLFYNSGEMGLDGNGKDKKSNGIDDDLNGFIDDYMGWDFTDRVGFPFDPTAGDYLEWDNDPLDQNIYSHGTAVMGIIGAETNNDKGIAGVAPNIKVLNLRAFDPGGYGEEDDVAAAILYAVKMKAKVINMSFGDNSFSYVLRDVIRYAYSQGVVLVASSGNSNSSAPHYPSGYSEVICVGNSTVEDYVASSSNYGSTLDLVAPGTLIMTTIRNYRYSNFNGTSAAAPFISAAAALILSMGDFSNSEVKQILKSTSDDIGEPGWDMRSGAGRLNLNKALTVLSAANVGFKQPTQDYATTKDTISISGSFLSPYFQSCDLAIGEGLNPTKWTYLLTDIKSQVNDSKIFDLVLSKYYSPLRDTTFTLRLIVKQNNGRTIEERVNFHLIRKNPEINLISLVPAFYGEKPTLQAAVYTPDNCIVRMYYKTNSENQFRFVTLDGFTTNNQFVKKLHYGFIPKFFANPGTEYEVFFEAENLVGLKTVIRDTTGTNFFVKTEESILQIPKKEMDFSLPPGSIFDKPLNFLSEFQNEVLIRENSDSKKMFHYKMENNSFVKVDSLEERIPRDFGDFNKNGKKDLLSYWFYYGYVYEQANVNASKLIEKSKSEEQGKVFWPVLASDIDKDNKTEIVTISGDSSINIFRFNNDLTYNFVDTLYNFSPKGFGGNLFDSPNGIVTDLNKDGVNELWFVDTDGDIISYKIASPTNYVPDKVLSTGYYSSSSYISSGDFNGDGKTEIAVLLHSVDEIDIANYHLLIVFNSDYEIIYDRAFIDPANEFNSGFQKSGNGLKFADIDNNGTDELILFVFPYSYIVKKVGNNYQTVFFEEGINSTSILVCDLNQNGIKEIAFPKGNKISFVEFTNADQPNTPTNLLGYSIDSSKIKLEWYSKETTFHIYRSEDSVSFEKIGSSSNKYYFDNNIQLNKRYYYKIQSFSFSFTNQYSDFTKSIQVLHHLPAKMTHIEVNSSNSIIANFDNLINTTILNLNAFKVLNSDNNETLEINSLTPNNQYSYLITLKKGFTEGNYNIFIKELYDAFGSPINNDSLSFNYVPYKESEEFYVESFEIINPYLVKVTFNKNIDSSSALNLSNYSFTPENRINGISFDNTKQNTLYIDLTNGNAVGAVGIEYRLKLVNLYSSYTTGRIKINENSGSIIVLTSQAEDLESVYFYPSPAKINNGDGFLTFANLPNFVEITIWNLSGEKIIELKESDGNGGNRWNLRDESGNLVDSGVYFYRLVRKDGKNNEIENKIGKIAVVK